MRVVLLHGVGLDASTWAPVVSRLGAGVDAVTPELLGHGSREPLTGPVTLAQLADDVAVSLHPGTHVVGFSLGALVGQQLAIDRPDLVATLACVSSVCDRAPDERAAVRARLRTTESDFAAGADASIARWFANGTATPETIAAVRRTLLANDVSSFLACYRVFAEADAELLGQLGRLTAPTLAVTGGDDPGSTPRMSRRLAELVPAGRAVIVEGARHMLPLECPAELTTILESFWSEHADA